MKTKGNFNTGSVFRGNLVACFFLNFLTLFIIQSARAQEGDQDGAQLGFSVANAGDVNGDGFADIIVGAPYYDSFNTEINHDAGRALLYLGSSTGTSSAPAWTAESDQEYANFGFSVAGAGDVNGDGFDDVIISAPYHDNGQTNEGRIYLYLGSASGLQTQPAWIVESDQDDAQLGYFVSSAGDVNGDGFDDIIAGAPDYDGGHTNEGRAFLYLGSGSGPSVTSDWTAQSDQNSASFGNAVSTAGDVNGDGFSDVIIGAYQYDHGELNEGRAYVYLGSSTGLAATPVWTAESNQSIAFFGYSVSSAGDVNGDGFDDILVGALDYDNGHTNEGRASLYLGSPTGPATTAAWITEANQDSAFLGYSVARAGDVNGDGFSDVIIGANGYDYGNLNEGRAYVFTGSATGLSLTPAWTREADQDRASYGYSVSCAGDMNGDGFDDIVVGSPLFDNTSSNDGRAFVYPGSALGLPGPEPTPTATPTAAPTSTLTPTPEPTATETPLPDPTPTETATETPTETPLPSETPTEGPTETPIPVATDTPDPSATVTASPTPTIDLTPTPTPTVDILLATPTEIGSPVETLAPTPVTSPSPTNMGGPALQAQNSLAGFVYDSAGRPISGAFVRAIRQSSAAALPIDILDTSGDVLSTTTNVVGYFEFTGLPNGVSYRIEVEYNDIEFACSITLITVGASQALVSCNASTSIKIASGCTTAEYGALFVDLEKSARSLASLSYKALRLMRMPQKPVSSKRISTSYLTRSRRSVAAALRRIQQRSKGWPELILSCNAASGCARISLSNSKHQLLTDFKKLNGLAAKFVKTMHTLSAKIKKQGASIKRSSAKTYKRILKLHKQAPEQQWNCSESPLAH